MSDGNEFECSLLLLVLVWYCSTGWNIFDHVMPARAHDFRSSRGPIGDAVEEVDYSIGQVMQALEAAGLFCGSGVCQIEKKA